MNNLEKHHFLNDLITTYKRSFKTERKVIKHHQYKLAATIRELSFEVQESFEDTKYFRAGLTSITIQSRMNQKIG